MTCLLVRTLERLRTPEKGRKWSPAGSAGNWPVPESSKDRRTFNYTDLPTFGNRFFASCKDISEFLMCLLSGPCNQGGLAAFQSFIWELLCPVFSGFANCLKGDIQFSGCS